MNCYYTSIYIDDVTDLICNELGLQWHERDSSHYGCYNCITLKNDDVKNNWKEQQAIVYQNDTNEGFHFLNDQHVIISCRQSALIKQFCVNHKDIHKVVNPDESH